MSFPTDDIQLGPASFGRRKGSEGIIWHTTESADASRASAVGTVIWQKTNPGSYNFIIYDGGLLLTVPYLEASGGVNPASSAWAPGRFPFLRASLSAAAYADPNAYLLNVAFSGKTAVFRDQGIPVNMIETAVALTRWVEAQPWVAGDLAHSGHQHWQTNRSDPSQKVLDLISASYAPEEDMPTLTTYALETIRIDAAAAIRGAPTTQGAPLFLSGRESSAVRVGTLVNAESEWSVYYLADRKRWGYTAKQNVLSVEPYQNTVEVPTGITPEQLAQAKRLEFGRGRDEGAAAYTAAGTVAARAVAP